MIAGLARPGNNAMLLKHVAGGASRKHFHFMGYPILGVVYTYPTRQELPWTSGIDLYEANSPVACQMLRKSQKRYYLTLILRILGVSLVIQVSRTSYKDYSLRTWQN